HRGRGGEADPVSRVKKDISVWEWVTGAIGFVLVVASVWILVASAMRETDQPPAVSVRVTSFHRAPDGWVAQIEVRNGGDLTAADLHVVGVLADSAGAVVEQAEARIDFLPGGSVRRGGLFFTRDPRSGRLSVRSIGYQEP
ncbi:MAG TPA: hypothetical protein VFZ21_20150, partial [Gemmatimonadaceae bacterium]|nr:hypothetical protein [Gemmatimonadaceae bacterium]